MCSEARSATPITFKRLLELAPAERLRELKQALERDMKLDRAAVLEWRILLVLRVTK
jgi:hypothetical protein